MNMSSPLVSIGIPTYNRAALIARAIGSALGQDYPNIEILISDNASTDGTAAICETIAATHANVRVHHQACNLGPTANFMTVLAMAKGKYFMWLGDDDHIDGQYVSVAVSTLEQDPLVELASGRPCYYRDGAFVFTGKVFSVLSSLGWLRLSSYYWQVTDNGVFYGLMRTATVRRLQFTNVMGGDWLLIAKIAAVGQIVTSPAVAVHRELGGASLSHRKTAQTLGLPAWQGVFPKVSLALNASRDIASGGHPFDDRVTRRGSLAAMVFCLLLLKTLVEQLAYVAMRGRNLLKRLNPFYHRRAGSR